MMRSPGSGGEAQRTALARMLVNRPSLLLFDEPFSALDVHLRSELQMELLDLLERIGKEYIIVTHSKDEAFRLSKSTYVLDNGNIIRHGIPSDVFRNPGTVWTARLVGYHNISRAKRMDGKLFLLEWGFSIDFPDSYAVAIPDDGAYFSDDGISASIVRVIDDEKATLLLLRFSGSGLF